MMAGRRWLWVLLLVLALAATACGQAYQWKGTPYPEGKVAADFDLVAEDGTPYRLSDHEGRVRLLFFGYTSCPDVCPTTLAEARQILTEMKPAEADQVEFLFITVDPERDTAEKLATYTDIFHPGITGLTGDPQALAQVMDEYGVIAEKEQLTSSAIGYIINHTARVFLVDPDGNLRLSYRFGTPPADILSDVQQLLRS
jgi:protein SCO1/2